MVKDVSVFRIEIRYSIVNNKNINTKECESVQVLQFYNTVEGRLRNRAS